MAYKITDREFVIRENGGDPIFRITAVLDSASDLEALGTEHAAGSIAMVADKGVPSYMLNASGEWKEV